jgi:hypothetical protein
MPSESCIPNPVTRFVLNPIHHNLLILFDFRLHSSI